MRLFDRMKTSWFPPQAEPSRAPRVAMRPKIEVPKPTVDERTAAAAMEILENHSFDRVFSRLKAEAFEEFTRSPAGDEGKARREAAHFKATVLDEIERSIRAMADDAKMHRSTKSAEIP